MYQAWKLRKTRPEKLNVLSKLVQFIKAEYRITLITKFLSYPRDPGLRQL